MKVRSHELSSEQKIETLDALYTAAGGVKGRAQMKLFLRDLLTESERIMMGRRILIARKLLSGESYEEICDYLGVSTKTIYKVHRWLDDQFPGYEEAIKNMEAEFAARKKKRDERYLYATSAIFRLKKKYPIHFLLFPWPKV